MSGEARQDFIFEMFKAGAADYLVKPIRRNEITALWQHAWRSMQDMAKGIPSAYTPLDLKVHNPATAAMSPFASLLSSALANVVTVAAVYFVQVPSLPTCCTALRRGQAVYAPCLNLVVMCREGKTPAIHPAPAPRTNLLAQRAGPRHPSLQPLPAGHV